MLRQVNVQAIAALLERKLCPGAKQRDGCNPRLAQRGIQRMDYRLAASGLSKLNGIKSAPFFGEAKIFRRIGMCVGIVERTFRHIGRAFAEYLPRSPAIDSVAVYRQPPSDFQ